MTTDANSGSSFNRYAYANDNPYKYIDPDGRLSCADMAGNCHTINFVGNDDRGGGSAGNAAADAAKFAGQQIGDAGSARAKYETESGKLNPSDSAGRKALKESTRSGTPKTIRDIISWLRPSTDAVGGSGNAAHSNASVNRMGAAFRVAGPGLAIEGLAYDAYTIANSPDQMRALMQSGGVTLGSLGGGAAGAVGGSLIMPGPGTVIGGVAGSAVGGAAGRYGAGKLYDWLHD